MAVGAALGETRPSAVPDAAGVLSSSRRSAASRHFERNSSRVGVGIDVWLEEVYGGVEVDGAPGRPAGAVMPPWVDAAAGLPAAMVEGLPTAAAACSPAAVPPALPTGLGGAGVQEERLGCAELVLAAATSGGLEGDAPPGSASIEVESLGK